MQVSIRRGLHLLSAVPLALAALGCGHSFEAARTEPRLHEPAQTATVGVERTMPAAVTTERVVRADRSSSAARSGAGSAAARPAPMQRPAVLVRPGDLFKRPPVRHPLVPPRPRR